MDDIWDYIVLELQNRSAAERVINRIIDAVDPLKNFAEMGTPLFSIADVGTDYRFLVSGNYMVFYRVQGCDVYIDRVLYGRKGRLSGETEGWLTPDDMMAHFRARANEE